MTTQNEAIRTDVEFKIASAEAIIHDITVDNVPYINVGVFFKTSATSDLGFSEATKTTQNRISALRFKSKTYIFYPT